MNNINENLLDPIIKNSLEYFDSNQPKIQKIINNIEYIEFIISNDKIDQIYFYNSEKIKFFESRYEILSIFIPQTNIWKWSWSLPTAGKKNTFITRKILEYAFNLNPEKDYLLKSTLINSKIKIINNIQLDIHLALSSYLSKKPFIFKFYIVPLNVNENIDENTKKNFKNLYSYKKVLNDKNIKNYISVYLLLIDY